jgi:hypothetical protein
VPFWTTLNPSEQNQVNAAIAFLGPVGITLALPAAAEDPAVWPKPPGTGTGWEPGSLGWHRVCSGKYDGAVRVVRTWGLDVEMHPEFWSRYVVAADALLSREWLDATGFAPSGLDWEALAIDQQALRAMVPT